eukprot:2736016-Prymnesium_polylepis.2
MDASRWCMAPFAWRGANAFKSIRSAYEALLMLAERRTAGGGAPLASAPSQPLIDASKSGDVDAVRRLLTQLSELDICTLDEDGLDALAWACRRGHHEVVDVLLAHADAAGATDAASAVTTTALDVERCPPL